MKTIKQAGNVINSEAKKGEEGKHFSSDKSMVDDIINFNYSCLYPYFSDYYRTAKKNVRMVFDKHWTQEEELEFSNAGRLPVNLPVMFPKVLTLLGTEKQNRKQYEAEPHGKEDELISEIINQIFRYNEKLTDPKPYAYTKSDVYQDGVLAVYGAMEIYVESDIYKKPVIKFRQVPYDEILFDLNFNDFEMTSCRRMQRHYTKYLEELIKEYPEKEAELNKIEEDFMDYNRFPLRDSVNTYFQHDSKHPERKIVRVIEDYHKVNVRVFRVFSLGDDKVYEAHSESEAENIQRDILASLMLDYDALSDEDLEKLFQVDEIVVEKIQKTVVAGTKVIEETNYLDIDEFPFTLYFSLFINGVFFTPVGVMMSVQQYVDRLFSQMDYSIGIDSKGGAEVDVNLIAENYNTVEQIKVAYTEGGLVFKDGQGRLLSPIDRTGTNPQFFTVFDMFFRLLEDGFGGRNFQGGSEGQNQSGKAITKLLQVANVMTNNYLDNLDRYDLLVGKKVYKYIKHYYDYDLSMKVLGKNFEIKMLEALKANGLYQESFLREGEGWLNYSPKNSRVKSIKDSDVVISVSKVNSRIDEAEETRESLFMLKNLGYNIPVQSILDTLPLKPTDKQTIVAYDEQMRQQQQELALKQMQFEGLNKMGNSITQASLAVGNFEKNEGKKNENGAVQ